MLITGAGGFVGSYLARAYAENGVRVTALVRGHTPRSALPAEIDRVSADLLDPAQTIAACRDHDLVVHAAAITRAHDRRSRSEQERVNVQMTANVVAACDEAGVGCLLYVSSTAAIGVPSDPERPADENARLDAELATYSYAASKLASERVALAASRPGLVVIVVNPVFVFGRSSGRYRGMDVIERVLRRRVVVCTPGGMSIAHVQDVTEGIRSAAARGRPGERYILGGENHTFRSIAETVCEIAGVKRVLVSLPATAGVLLGQLQSLSARVRGDLPNLSLQRRFAHQFYSSRKAYAELGYEYRPFSAIVQDYLDNS